MAYSPTADDISDLAAPTPIAASAVTGAPQGNYTPAPEDVSDIPLNDPRNPGFWPALGKAAISPLAGIGHGLMTVGRGLEENMYRNPTLVSNILGGALQTAIPFVPAPMAANVTSSIKNNLSQPGAVQNIINNKNTADQQFNSQYGNYPAAQIGNFIGQAAPYVAGGEVAGLAEAPAWISQIAKSYPAFKNSITAAGVIGKNAAYGAGSNMLAFDPNENSNYIHSALMGGLVGAAGGAGIPFLNKGLSTPLSSEELAQNLADTQGTKTPLGQVIQSPGWTRMYENFLGRLPASGAVKQMQQTTAAIDNQAKDVLSQMKGSYDSNDVNDALNNELKNQLNNLQTTKQNNYSGVNSLANDLGVNINKNNFANTARNYLEEIKADPHLASEMDKGVLSDLEKYSAYDQPVNPSASPSAIVDSGGNAIPSASDDLSGTLKNSNIFRSKIGQKANDAFMNNGKNSYEFQIYNSLKNSMGNDIENSISNAKSPELSNQYSNAQKFYADNIAPYEDPNISKFVRQKADTDTLLNTFIRPGTMDRSNLIENLVNKLPQDKQSLPAYGYFSKALDDKGNIDSVQLMRLYDKLGPNQKEALFSFNPDLKARMDSLTNVIDKNQSAYRIMANPDTGQKMMDLLPLMVSRLVGGGVGAEEGREEGGGLVGAGLGGILGSLLIPGLAARPLTKALTSQTVRNALVKRISQGKKLIPGSNYIMGGLAGIPANSQPLK